MIEFQNVSKTYPNGTHALYEEERDFNRRVLDFLARPLV